MECAQRPAAARQLAQPAVPASAPPTARTGPQSRAASAVLAEAVPAGERPPLRPRPAPRAKRLQPASFRPVPGAGWGQAPRPIRPAAARGSQGPARSVAGGPTPPGLRRPVGAQQRGPAKLRSRAAQRPGRVERESPARLPAPVRGPRQPGVRRPRAAPRPQPWIPWRLAPPSAPGHRARSGSRRQPRGRAGPLPPRLMPIQCRAGRPGRRAHRPSGWPAAAADPSAAPAPPVSTLPG
ncbi:hypothetical protein DFQ59_106155 [Thioalbus denitrificans]|uniref:Uncharacterized protein n=1 Tax=Thioalbus denitrificans TaxID=547122 RepID=A0A369C7C7_9GAMM|nr:hypothetical protein DFQ59_106155 [Thioalbus denitrificans]